MANPRSFYGEMYKWVHYFSFVKSSGLRILHWQASWRMPDAASPFFLLSQHVLEMHFVHLNTNIYIAFLRVGHHCKSLNSFFNDLLVLLFAIAHFCFKHRCLGAYLKIVLWNLDVQNFLICKNILCKSFIRFTACEHWNQQLKRCCDCCSFKESKSNWNWKKLSAEGGTSALGLAQVSCV